MVKDFPIEERFALADQLRRAVTSVPINIAEGFGRFSSKEKSHFIQIAYGSLTEVMCEIELSLDNEYITQEVFNYIEQEIIIISKQLSAYLPICVLKKIFLFWSFTIQTSISCKIIMV